MSENADKYDIKLPKEVRVKIIAGLEGIIGKFWENAESHDVVEFMTQALVYGDKGRLPIVYRTDEQLVEELIEWSVDGALEFFFIAPCEESRKFPLEVIRARLEQHSDEGEIEANIV